LDNKLNQHWLNLLSYKFSPLLLSEIVPASSIIVAAPHHAPKGSKKMFCDRNADENAGFLAAWLAQILNCSCLIASRYFFDPNKSMDSDYFKFIEKINPELVIEIHGHGAKLANYDIEISAGPQLPLFAKGFAQKLLNLTKKDALLKAYSISGDYHKIYYTAQYSLSITDDRWKSLHIELPPKLRRSPDYDLPPPAGFLLMEYIAQIVRQL
jgi:hypothetical protein